MWSGSLLVALIAGAIIGMYRVDILKDLMTDTMPTQQIVTQLLLTLFSIGGPLWLAWLSTQQINQRFKLSEDYAYKATIAKSFVGFQKIANRFDTTTEERLFNSTLDRFDEMPLRLVEGKDYNSPWHELLDSDTLKRAIEVFPELAKEISKFSSKTNLRNRKLGQINRLKPTKQKLKILIMALILTNKKPPNGGFFDYLSVFYI